MKHWLTTSRITGIFYLGLAIAGMFAFLFARTAIFVDGDASMTASNLVDNELLARFGLVAELILVAFQALAAIWFYKLFRKKSNFGAGLITVFGMVNAITILISSAMWLSALNVATSGGQADTVYSLFRIHDNIWTVAGLFFGLWLLPMAYMASLAQLPRALVWFLVTGGFGYMLATFVSIIMPEQKTIAEILSLPATVGEFWIIGYLLRGRLHDKEIS